jgi:TetR/AcrR family transcriptional regulator
VGNPGKRLEPPEMEVRDRLLTCATELFTRKGYAATTVREIVTAAGVTKPVLYYYFKNKEGIYLELLREPYSKLEALLEAVRDPRGTATSRLLKFSDQVFSLFVEHLQTARLMYSIYYGPPQGAPFFDFDSYHLKFHDVIRRLIREGIRRGELKKGNVEDMMWAVVSAVNVVMEVQLCHPEMKMDRRNLARILRWILRGIATGNTAVSNELPAINNKQ